MPDWKSVLRTVFVSRALDALEETRLVPDRKVLYQFCARGHDVTQVLLGLQLTGRRDAVSPYYRSRPLALTLGLPAEEALASTMMRAEGMSGGRDIGVVINRPNRSGPCLLPACGGVGTQYTPATGWAQALVYRGRILKDPEVAGSIAVAHGGEASTVDQRLLGVAQHRDDRAPAAAVLHRGQRLRHLGAGREADAGRRHRREPRILPEPADPRRRRLRADRGCGTDRESRARRSRR